MEKDLGNYRKSYDKGSLLEQSINKDPFDLFQLWFNEVDTHFQDTETNAMTLSTIGNDGFPKSRVVLLKKFSSAGFVFYTNYESEKARALADTPQCCLSFHWEGAERQVIIKGVADKIDPLQSDAYFLSRPKGSQLGAWASKQSTVIDNRAVLDTQLESLENEYKIKPLKRPEFWGGYIVKPVEIEFWQGRANRLHDRIRFKLSANNSWDMDRLSP
jgi:pyridoxamine 5'-phosphate oxidase|tara:strand:- start:1292 stop:1939 length:648 start_codon:yes stop_codon:yes gene_type:complete